MDENSAPAGPGPDYVVPALPDRWVILHHHIFKNAGSTVDFALKRAFNGRFATIHGPTPDSVLRHSDVLRFLCAHPDVAAVSSHHLTYPKPSQPGWVFFDLCFFRDPLLRLWSMYRYLRRAESAGELGDLAKSMAPGAFFELLIEERPHLVNDVQVNILANGGAYTRPPSPADLDAAVATLGQISILGVVELFDQSLVAAEYFLQPAFARLQFHYVRQNASPAARSGLREEIGEGLYGHLRDMNRLDYRLLDLARQEVLRRYALVPQREERLAEFHSRCEALRRERKQAA